MVHEVVNVDAEIAKTVRHPNSNENSETGRTMVAIRPAASNHTKGRTGFLSVS